jgi:hypothetical protein
LARAGAADHDQAIDAGSMHPANGQFDTFFGLKLRTTGRAQHRAAALDNAAHVARAEPFEVALNQSRVALVDAPCVDAA